MPEATQVHRTRPPANKALGPQDAASGNTSASEMKTNSATAEPMRMTNPLKARKRTKTGCLTCRKRRIKCGEERPTCKNCVKSKRECEGYIPRVIFKDPLGAFRPTQQGIAARTQHSSHSHGAASIYGGLSSASVDTPIAPRLLPFGEQTGLGQVPMAGGPIAAGNFHGPSGYTHGVPTYSVGNSASKPLHASQMGYSHGNFPSSSTAEDFAQSRVDSFPYQTFQQQGNGNSDSVFQTGISHVPHRWPQNESDPMRSTEVPAPHVAIPNLRRQEFHPDQVHQSTHWLVKEESAFDQTQNHASFSSFPIQGHSEWNGVAVQDVPQHQTQSQNRYYGVPAQAVWVEEPEEDEYFDVESDEEDLISKSYFTGTTSYDLGAMVAITADQGQGRIRSMTNFLNEPNILATYFPSYAASPLRDPQTARVFCHFITATAPTLSVCERHPSNPALIFSGKPVPWSQRALWSYTLPMRALTHQGLLHAMLALASLHIATLQQTSSTPSLKHYHYALRRVAKALGNQKKRQDVATLAATQLLGFYEVTTAEHNKWNSHLAGARELIMDIGFARMAKRIEAHRQQQEEVEARHKQEMQLGLANAYWHEYAQGALDDFPSRIDRQLDERLISTIMGRGIRYDQHGHITDEGDPVAQTESPLTAHDIENFEIQCDLFWWYVKHDIYQSIISGNRLLLSYDQWGHCPPRAPIGRLDAVCGSLDHLLLLMGRLAEFAAKDLPRKRRAYMDAAKRSNSSTQQGPPLAPNGQQPPQMYGMMPDPGPVRLPRGFDQAQHDRLYTAPVPSEDQPLEAATREAEAEWSAIAHAFDVYAASLGPDYAPLSPEHMTPTATPFGPALYYRAYSISCVLIMYYMGRIICSRCHPSMPPAAMAAAGVAAPQTAVYANTIGRIFAGIQPIDSTLSINPHHGAAMMDGCMGLFHAGVQYRDPAQRGWTITKLRDVARLTGWQTSGLIASGCERAWIKAADMGKGPPYTMMLNPVSKDDRLSGRGHDPSQFVHPPKDNNDRRFITVNAGTRVYWAMGVLGVDEDFKGMNLNE